MCREVVVISRYILRRLGATIIVVLCVLFITFTMMRMAPGDPALMMLGDNSTQEQIQAMHASLGLDKPLIVQFGIYLMNMFRGDFGTSMQFSQPCLSVVSRFFPRTLELAIAAGIIAVVISIPLGIIAGVKQGSGVDLFCMFFAMIGQSLSVIVLGLILVIVFSVQLNWLPSMGTGGFQYLILPALTLGLPQAAIITRMARSGMIDVLKEDYITATFARGISSKKVYLKYAMKNALIPVITIIGLSIANLLGGSVVTENIFGWPGLGTLVKTSITNRDYALVQTIIMLIAVMVAVMNFLIDIINSLVDHRITMK